MFAYSYIEADENETYLGRPIDGLLVVNKKYKEMGLITIPSEYELVDSNGEYTNPFGKVEDGVLIYALWKRSTLSPS